MVERIYISYNRSLRNLYTFCLTGIIESDDIQHVTTEIDKALNFSRKVQMLVDSVKHKYKHRYVSYIFFFFCFSCFERRA